MRKKTGGATMYNRNRMLLSTVFGVILASVMIVGLSTFNSLYASQEILVDGSTPVEETKLVGGNIEASEDFMEAAERNFSISESSEEAGLDVYTDPDLIGIGAPFSIAIVVGLVMFITVRNRLDQ